MTSTRNLPAVRRPATLAVRTQPVARVSPVRLSRRELAAIALVTAMFGIPLAGVLISSGV